MKSVFWVDDEVKSNGNVSPVSWFYTHGGPATTEPQGVITALSMVQSFGQPHVDGVT